MRKPIPNRKILFLDFDGVLKTESESSPGFTQQCVNELKRIVGEVPDLRIVISSSWREKFGLFRVGWMWRQYGMKEEWVIDRTPVKLFDTRGGEILSWLNDAGPMYGVVPDAKFAVLEDEPDWIFPDIPKENAFICDPAKGLTRRLASRVIQYLKND